MTRRLTALSLALAFIATACSSIGGTVKGYEVQAQFSRTYNLFPGSPVRVLGVDVGVVASITTAPSDDFVTVTLQVDEDVEFPADVNAVIIPAALLGERYVQLDPPYTGGPAMAPGATIPVARTIVPSEFDEILESLNNFVGEVDDTELVRFVDNLADALTGNGAALGETIDAARGAIDVLRENDEQLIALVSRLSDLNETLGTRDQALGRLINDFNLVMTSLADDRTDIDAALSGLVRVSNKLAVLLEEHRPDLQADIETLARVGRTAQRNLDQISMSVLSQAELFRHATRVVNTQKNWLPLVNHAGELAKALADEIGRRLAATCARIPNAPAALCDQLDVGGLVPTGICAPPFVACPSKGAPNEGEVLTIPEVIRQVVEEIPLMRDALRDDAERRRTEAEGVAP